MNRIRSIIIDDEAANRMVLNNLLEKYCPSVEVIASAESAEEAYVLIGRHRPQLVFLDVHMPVRNGFDLLRMFDEISFHVIFVTAFNNHAIQAFEFNAVDYILKPIDQSRLIKSVDRTEERIRQSETTDVVHFIRRMDEETQLLKSISLHHKDRVQLIDIDRISYVQARRNYCEVVTADNQRFISAKTLSDYEQLLEPYNHFLRISKGYIINVHFILSYSKGPVYTISMRNHPEEMEIPRRKKRDIMCALQDRLA